MAEHLEKDSRDSSGDVCPAILLNVFALVPFFLMLLTWGRHDATWHLKIYGWPIAAAELALVLMAFRHRVDIRLNVETTVIFIFFVLAWTAAATATDQKEAVIRTALWTLHALFGFAALRMWRPADFVRGVNLGFLACACGLAVFALSAPPDTNWLVDLPGLGNPRMFGLFASVVIGVSLGALARRDRFASIYLLIAFTTVFWTGSRGAAAASLATLILALAFFPTIRRADVVIPFLGIGGISASLARWLGSPSQLSGVDRMAETGDNGRWDLWMATISRIVERPWFGYGEGQTQVLTQIANSAHPHNVVLQILLAWGIVGLACLVLLATRAAKRCYLQITPERLPLVCGLITLLSYSMVDGALYNVHTASLFAAMLGLCLRPAAPPDPHKTGGPMPPAHPVARRESGSAQP